MASLGTPYSVAVDPSGNVFFTDTVNHLIRKLTPNGANYRITTVVGTPGIGGFSGDNGQGYNIQLNMPCGVTVDSAGNIYIADWGNSRVRKLVKSTGIINTVAGNGNYGLTGNGGQAINARVVPSGVAVDSAGNIFILCIEHNVIRKVNGPLPRRGGKTRKLKKVRK